MQPACLVVLFREYLQFLARTLPVPYLDQTKHYILQILDGVYWLYEIRSERPGERGASRRYKNAHIVAI